VRAAGHDLGLDVVEEMADKNVWTGEILPLENHVIRREMNSCIRDVVFKLPETYRTVIVLGEFEGLKNEAIAIILGRKLEAVKIRLHRARLKLKEELSKQCILYRDERNEFACEQKHDSFVGKDPILSLVKNKPKRYFSPSVNELFSNDVLHPDGEGRIVFE
jgi:hypothetical protein